jgi:predicted metal-dependent HD superfamily phosphohydrolase
MNDSITPLEARMSAAWHELASPYHCRATRVGILDPIIRRYRQPHRHYHTLEHIEEMLAIIDEHRERLLEYEPIAFATWFHDIVYDPRRDDNEERSAIVARRTMPKLMVHGWMTLRAVALIRATRGHEPPDASFDSALFIDADLAILGADPERYRRYATDIRREHAHLSDDEYRLGRRTILERFLARTTIYHTDPMRDRLEARARANILAELADLADD